MAETTNYLTALTSISCGSCGGTYAISERYREQKHTEGGYWNCPYCRVSWGYGESALSRKEKEIARLQSRIEHKEAALVYTRQERDAAENSRRALKGVVTRTKRRVGHGVCPCCNRTFKDLADHMKAKHPSYIE